jgi:hypothetical protein
MIVVISYGHVLDMIDGFDILLSHFESIKDPQNNNLMRNF